MSSETEQGSWMWVFTVRAEIVEIYFRLQKWDGLRMQVPDTMCVKRTSFKLMTVTWHWVFGDPLGSRMQGVKDCAHLLAVWHLSAGQGEQLEEGAQKERTVDWWAEHGRRAALQTGQNRATNSRDKLQHIKSYRRIPCSRWWGEAAAPGSARISILLLFLFPFCPQRVRPPGKLLGLSPVVKLLRCW